MTASYSIALSGKRGAGLFVRVDEADLDMLLAHRWHHDGHYATTNIQREHVRMHALILGRTRGDPGDVDHINRNKLDNRRSNLRVVSHAVNGRNRSAVSTSTSQHRGVSWDASRGKWKAQARRNYRMHFLGRFASEAEAAAAAEAFWAQDETYLYDKLKREAAAEPPTEVGES